MRRLKRWFRRWRAYRAVRPQLEADYRLRLERTFGGPVTWRHTGGRGRDVVCLVFRDGLPVGVLRVTDPAAQPSAPASACLPFVSLAASEKIGREWLAYERGAPLGLTPQPLWRDGRAMLCAYVDARPLQRVAEQGGRSALALATDAVPHIARLHAAGVTHMDMSLSNILGDPARQRCVFVDFEYGPATGLSFEQQALYDYLRLLESVWKFLTPEERKNAPATWGAAVLRHAPRAVRTAELSPLRPALGRILSAPELKAFFAELSASSFKM